MSDGSGQPSQPTGAIRNYDFVWLGKVDLSGERGTWNLGACAATDDPGCNNAWTRTEAMPPQSQAETRMRSTWGWCVWSCCRAGARPGCGLVRGSLKNISVLCLIHTPSPSNLLLFLQFSHSLFYTASSFLRKLLLLAPIVHQFWRRIVNIFFWFFLSTTLDHYPQSRSSSRSTLSQSLLTF